jgi:hypothetical protein
MYALSAARCVYITVAVVGVSTEWLRRRHMCKICHNLCLCSGEAGWNVRYAAMMQLCQSMAAAAAVAVGCWLVGGRGTGQLGGYLMQFGGAERKRPPPPALSACLPALSACLPACPMARAKKPIKRMA